MNWPLFSLNPWLHTRKKSECSSSPKKVHQREGGPQAFLWILSSGSASQVKCNWMRPVCGIQGTWPRASTTPPSPPIPSLPILPLPGSGYPSAPLLPSFPWMVAGSLFCSPIGVCGCWKACVCMFVVYPRQVFVTLFGLVGRAPVTVPVAAALANVTGLAEVRRRLSFNQWSLRTTHLIRLDLRFTAAGVTQPNPGVNQLITDPCVLRLCHHRGYGEGGQEREEAWERWWEKKRHNIDFDIKRSTVRITKQYIVFFSLEKRRVWGSGLQHLGHTHYSPQADTEA